MQSFSRSEWRLGAVQDIDPWNVCSGTMPRIDRTLLYCRTSGITRVILTAKMRFRLLNARALPGISVKKQRTT